MRKIVLISLILFFIQGCGKKGSPEYQAMKVEQNKVVNFKR